MNASSIARAMEEAKRFLAAAKVALADNQSSEFCGGTRITGTLRRASLDLTRALADMRKP